MLVCRISVPRPRLYLRPSARTLGRIFVWGSRMDNAWHVFDYERDMVMKLSHRLVPEQMDQLEWDIRNAVVESAVLHTRVLCDILLSKGTRDDDITLHKLIPDFVSPVIEQLRAVYGTAEAKGTPCWQFNKMMAHPTTHRSTSHDYVQALNTVWPTMQELLEEIQLLREVVRHVVTGEKTPAQIAIYAVHVRNDQGSEIAAQVFTGETAYSDGCEHVEKMKKWDRAHEIWFTRMDGPEPTWVMKPLKRGEDGKWFETT